MTSLFAEIFSFRFPQEAENILGSFSPTDHPVACKCPASKSFQVDRPSSSSSPSSFSPLSSSSSASTRFKTDFEKSVFLLRRGGARGGGVKPSPALNWLHDFPETDSTPSRPFHSRATLYHGPNKATALRSALFFLPKIFTEAHPTCVWGG